MSRPVMGRRRRNRVMVRWGRLHRMLTRVSVVLVRMVRVMRMVLVMWDLLLRLKLGGEQGRAGAALLGAGDDDAPHVRTRAMHVSLRGAGGRLVHVLSRIVVRAAEKRRALGSRADRRLSCARALRRRNSRHTTPPSTRFFCSPCF